MHFSDNQEALPISGLCETYMLVTKEVESASVPSNFKLVKFLFIC